MSSVTHSNTHYAYTHTHTPHIHIFMNQNPIKIIYRTLSFYTVIYYTYLNMFTCVCLFQNMEVPFTYLCVCVYIILTLVMERTDRIYHNDPKIPDVTSFPGMISCNPYTVPMTSPHAHMLQNVLFPFIASEIIPHISPEMCIGYYLYTERINFP